MLFLCLFIQRGMRVTPLGFCLRVIVNEKPLNLKKTTFSVLFVILIDLKYLYYQNQKLFNLKSDKGFTGTVVNRTLPSLHRRSLEITLTVPLSAFLITSCSLTTFF